LALQLAELQHRLALGQRVVAQVGVLKAVQKAGLLHPQVMANPCHTQQGLAVVRGTYALHGVPLRRPVGRQRIPDAPDVAATLEADVKLAIRPETRITDKAAGIHRRAVGENGSSAVKNSDLTGSIDDGPARLGGGGHELKAGDFLNSGNENVTV